MGKKSERAFCEFILLSVKLASFLRNRRPFCELYSFCEVRFFPASTTGRTFAWGLENGNLCGIKWVVIHFEIQFVTVNCGLFHFRFCAASLFGSTSPSMQQQEKHITWTQATVQRDYVKETDEKRGECYVRFYNHFFFVKSESDLL